MTESAHATFANVSFYLLIPQNHKITSEIHHSAQEMPILLVGHVHVASLVNP